MAELFWLSDRQWSMIVPLLPHLSGKRRVDDRRVISGIAARTIDDLWDVIRDALSTFTPRDRASYFTATGYEPDRTDSALVLVS